MRHSDSAIKHFKGTTESSDRIDSKKPSLKSSPLKPHAYEIDEEVRNKWLSVIELEKKRFSFFDELFAMGYVADSLEVLGSPPKAEAASEENEEEYFVEADEKYYRRKVNYGRIVFKTKHMYTGNLQDWYFEGLGRYYWQDGTVYVGEFSQGVMNGQGSFHLPDGYVFEGHFVNGQRTDSGLYTSKEGQTYVGNWVDGLPHGEGKMWYDPDDDENDYYDGVWARGLPNGCGTRQYATGDRYVGSWVNGVRNGYGIMMWLQERQVYKGEWVDGLPHGTGKHLWYLERSPTSSFPTRHVYEGEWVKGKREGIGKMVYPCGSVYDGRWRNGQRNGKGIYVNPAGEILVGLFRAGSILGGTEVPLHAPTYEGDYESLAAWLGARFKLETNFDKVEAERLRGIIKLYLPYIRKLYHRAGEFSQRYGNHGLYPAFLKRTPKQDNTSKMQIHHNLPITEPKLSSTNTNSSQADKTFARNQRRVYDRFEDTDHMKGRMEKPEALDGVNPVTRFGLWLIIRDCEGLLDDVTMAYYDKIWVESPPISFQTRHNPFEPVYLWQFLEALIATAITYYVQIPHINKFKENSEDFALSETTQTTINSGVSLEEHKRSMMTRKSRAKTAKPPEEKRGKKSHSNDKKDRKLQVAKFSASAATSKQTKKGGGESGEMGVSEVRISKEENKNKEMKKKGLPTADNKNRKINSVSADLIAVGEDVEESNAEDEMPASKSDATKNSRNGKETTKKVSTKKPLANGVAISEKEKQKQKRTVEKPTGRNVSQAPSSEVTSNEDETLSAAEEENTEDEVEPLPSEAVRAKRKTMAYTGRARTAASDKSKWESDKSVRVKRAAAAQPPNLITDAGADGLTGVEEVNEDEMPPLEPLFEFYGEGAGDESGQDDLEPTDLEEQEGGSGYKPRPVTPDSAKGPSYSSVSLSDCFEMFMRKKLLPCLKREPGRNLPVVPQPLPALSDMYDAFKGIQNADIIRGPDFLRSVLPHMVSPNPNDAWHKIDEKLSLQMDGENLIQLSKDKSPDYLENNDLLGMEEGMKEGMEEKMEPDVESEYLGARAQESETILRLLKLCKENPNDASCNNQGGKGDEFDADTGNLADFATEGNPFDEEELVPRPLLWADDYKCVPVQKRSKHFEGIETQDVYQVLERLYPNLLGESEENQLDFDLIFCDWLWCTSLLAKTSVDKEFQSKAWDMQSETDMELEEEEEEEDDQVQSNEN